MPITNGIISKYNTVIATKKGGSTIVLSICNSYRAYIVNLKERRTMYLILQESIYLSPRILFLLLS